MVLPWRVRRWLGPIDIFADYEFGGGMIEDKLHSKPLVSVVILDLDGHRFWPELLAALENQSFRDFELIVVENGGKLDLPQWLGEVPVRVLAGRGNLGFAGGVNWGASRARGEWLALLNNDAVPEPDWLLELVSTMREKPEAGAVCSKVLFYDRYVEVEVESPVFVPSEIGESDDDRTLGLKLKLGRTQVSKFARKNTCLPERDGWIWTKGRSRLLYPVPSGKELEISFFAHPVHAGKPAFFTLSGVEQAGVTLVGGEQVVRFSIPDEACFDVVNSAGNRFDPDWNLIEQGLYERDGPRFSRLEEIEMGSGCALLLRNSILGEAPFDETFFAYYEDSDLSLRLRRLGYSVLFQPRSRVRHHGSATSVTRSPFQVFFAVRNRLWMVAKHAPWKVVGKALTRDFWEFGEYARHLDSDFSLTRLKRETRWGVLKRLWMRLCDA